MKIGYTRVSTEDQTTALQRDALLSAGCDRIYEDHGVSGVAAKRPQFDRCIRSLCEGDVLVVWKLDRLGRSLSHLLELADQLRNRRVGFQCLSEAIDTTTPQGTLVFHLLGALAQFERSLIAERTAAGRTAAKNRGVRFGRPRALTAQQLGHIRQLVDGGRPVPEAAKLLGVSRATAYRALQRAAI